MLRPWREQVVAYLGSGRVSLLRLSGGLRNRVLDHQSSAVPGGYGAGPDAALAALRNLCSNGNLAGANARVIVSNAWVRHGIVPAPAVKLNADGRLSHARYLLTDLYGDDVAEWKLTLSDAPPGKAYVACAMPEKIEAEIESIFSLYQGKVVSIQPELPVSYNAWRRELLGESVWYVSLDESFLTAVYIECGRWARIHVARTYSKWNLELRRFLGVSRLSPGHGGEASIYVDAIKEIRQAGSAEFRDLKWLDPEVTPAAMPEMLLLDRVAS